MGFGAGPRGGSASGRYSKPSQVIVRHPTVFNDRAFVKLSHLGVTSLPTGAAGAVAIYSFNPNDMKSGPLNTVVSGQMPGFTKWCSSTGPYLSYIVHGFKIRLQAAQGNVDGGMAVGVMTVPTSASAPTAMKQFLENRGKVVQLQPLLVRYITEYQTVAQVYGQSRETVAIADSFSALYNAVPSSEVTTYIGVQGNSGVLQYMQCTLQITCYLEFFGRQNF